MAEVEAEAEGVGIDIPDAAELAALRAWYEGVSARDAARRYLVGNEGDDVVAVSPRRRIDRLRRRLAACARVRHRPDLAEVFEHRAAERIGRATVAVHTIELLRALPVPTPLIGDDIARWLPAPVASALQAAGLETLAAVAVRRARRRRWWTAVPGLGAAGARRIDVFFERHPALLPSAAVVVTASATALVPWERLRPPQSLDGSQGTFRAPPATCALDAGDDYRAVQAWLMLHEAPATRRAYRKEAERLMLWAIVERGRALSSLTTEDAVAYRTFLRQPQPQARWIGPPRPRASAEWRPFTGGLSARSTAHALSVLGALFRWLVEQRYLLANPFAGLKVRGSGRTAPFDASRVFAQAEWTLLRTVADGLEWSYSWSAPAAQRLRFLLDFGYATGLRAGELVAARLGDIETDAAGDAWLHLVGKGSKPGKVALPPLACMALERYLAQRGLPSMPDRCDPGVPLVGRVGPEDATGISGARLWTVVRRFFRLAAGLISEHHPATADRLRRASPHWMRHTHATHALARGATLITVRDNLRHASISTTSVYLHGDEAERARQLRAVFAAMDGG